MSIVGWFILALGLTVSRWIDSDGEFYWLCFVFASCLLLRVLIALNKKGKKFPVDTARMFGVISMPLFVADLYLIIFGTAGLILSELIVEPIYGDKFASGLNLLIHLSGFATRIIYWYAIIRRPKSQASEITSSNF